MADPGVVGVAAQAGFGEEDHGADGNREDRKHRGARYREAGLVLRIDVGREDRILDADEGVVDPTRVIKEAIQNAVSIAGTAMTMGALVVDIPEKTPAASPDMGGGMGMM